MAKLKIPRSLIVAAIVTSVLPYGTRSSTAQETSGLRIPDHFGIYAIEGSETFGITVPRSTFEPSRVEVQAISGLPSRLAINAGDWSSGEFSESVPRLAGSFLVYAKPSLAVLAAAGGLELYRARFAGRLSREYEDYRGNRLVSTWSNALIQRWLLLPSKRSTLGVPTGSLGDEVELLIRPGPGQDDETVIVEPAIELQPGLYRLWGALPEKFFTFLVGSAQDALESSCVDFNDLWNGPTTLEPCGSSQPPGTDPGQVPPVVSPPADVGCRSFRTCLVAASSSFKAGRLDQALAEAEKASTLEPSDPKSWELIGDIYLEMERYGEVVPMWDRFFQLGGKGAFGMCRGKKLSCSPGVMKLSTSKISFVDQKGNTFIDTAVAEVSAVESKRIAHTRFEPSARLVVTIAGNKHRLDPMPASAKDCVKDMIGYVCPEPGSSQQAFTADYLASTIAAMANGTFDAGEPPPEPENEYLLPFAEGEYTESPHGFKATHVSELDPAPVPVWHLGQDYCASDYSSEGDSLRGTAFRPIADGRVVGARLTKPSVEDGVGNYLIIEHGELVAAYFHLAKVYKDIGEEVSAGEIVGEAGDVSLHPPSVTCPHLHLEIRRKGQADLAVRPNTGRFGYVSIDGITRIDPPLGSSDAVSTWMGENFVDPRTVLKERAD